MVLGNHLNGIWDSLGVTGDHDPFWKGFVNRLLDMADWIGQGRNDRSEGTILL